MRTKSLFPEEDISKPGTVNCCISVAGTISAENLDGVDTSFDKKSDMFSGKDNRRISHA